ncbi:putative hydroxymethylpyrimidine transporter CytX [Lactobacillus sp. ESL0791]|uniref:putative hydroxymethylpyrimidine transporter CytX n=1 Tax=Lactobacillus sp. ESL0791 TaxID=2983234 RepID=UPI0023F64D43|nr:putative hydroxymethylpyrimidine transporter CytX [Lactobacillus sp. ESL0791]MDF7638027.1 putative hydroxymethylpyrimidine transporter CytX [Lactobacillus sp. ESL0791]
MKNTKLSSLFLLWFGTAISIAEIVTGTLMAPLGWGKGITAVIIGHVIGCFLFLLPAAYLSAIQKKTAITVTGNIFGKTGVILFSLLNAIQLIGWTAVMIVTAQVALNSMTGKLFHFQNSVLMAIIVAALIIVWLLFNHDWLFKINNTVVILLTIGVIIIAWIFTTKHFPMAGTFRGHISFGSAVELNVTMALSWLPVIGDYTCQEKQPFKSSLVSVSGYFLGSSAMFILGLLTVVKTGQSNFTTALAQTNLGLVTLLIIIFSTVTTTFMDAYSAATSLDNILHRGHVNLLAILATIIGLVISLAVSLNYYQNFLNAIGAVFTPLFAILFVSIFIIKRNLGTIINFGWWLIGVIAYSFLQRLDFVWGTTFLLLLFLLIGLLVTSLFVQRQVK